MAVGTKPRSCSGVLPGIIGYYPNPAQPFGKPVLDGSKPKNPFKTLQYTLGRSVCAPRLPAPLAFYTPDQSSMSSSNCLNQTQYFSGLFLPARLPASSRTTRTIGLASAKCMRSHACMRTEADCFLCSKASLGTPIVAKHPNTLRKHNIHPIPRKPLQTPSAKRGLTRVNSTNVLDVGLRIGETGRRMNSKVRLVKISVYRK
jgi:hypothetical protein